ncbi:(Fe-S)-binding protein [Gordonia jinhuaensis]|uniref:Fe-S oxidoreductase n=1 Tax=Gordonia jinhuaensis TaxID=1517702 RepID=A0A916T6F4_9ACTN|nr:(Fe-S)-binding protein [Gordonia jinhuaensis]GGB30660.1 Fe-S oxidoreductase [Gordonia jinhuaensis]
MRIALFIACFNDVMYPQTGKAMVSLLRRLGHEVVFPADQTCCGQMHFNTGYQDDCIPLAERFCSTFDPYDVVLAASGSCASMVKEYYPVVADRAKSPALKARSESVSSRLYELSELLIDVLGVTDTGSYFPHSVTYHPTCHTLRMLKIGERPLTLLRNVDSIDIVDLPEPEECCGFGGTFSVRNGDTSAAMGTDKVASAMSTHAEILTAADNSCLMHLGGILSRARSSMRPLHYAEILASTREHPLDTGEAIPAVERPVDAWRSEQAQHDHGSRKPELRSPMHPAQHQGRRS